MTQNTTSVFGAYKNLINANAVRPEYEMMLLHFYCPFDTVKSIGFLCIQILYTGDIVISGCFIRDIFVLIRLTFSCPLNIVIVNCSL